MQYTNLANLPQPLASAIMRDTYDRVGHISVTGLILPPRIRILEKRHDAEMVEDVSKGMFRLFGSAVGVVLERANQDNVFVEERLRYTVNGWTVSGKIDLMRLNPAYETKPGMTYQTRVDAYAIDDYKLTSVWAMKDGKPEWEQQLNLYAYLARVHGFDIRKLRIIGMLRDWSVLKAAREQDKDYPQVGVVVREVPLWSIEAQEKFLCERVELHQEAEHMSDDELPMCTDAERWKRGEAWAVKKKGNKRAAKIYTDELTAKMDRDENWGAAYEIEHRPGSYIRCESYCAAAPFCSFGKSLIGKAGDEEAA